MKSLVKLSEKNYYNIIIFIVPALNFLSGTTIDLFSPSLPTVASYFNVSIVLAKSTITVAILGLALGSFFFGALLDIINSKKALIIALLVYCLISFSVHFYGSIYWLLIARFFQGFLGAATAVGSRKIVFENFKEKRLNIALLYTSIAYGLGPIIGPFIGGILQYHFNWQANFIAYGLIACILLLAVLLFLNTAPKDKPRNIISSLLKGYAEISRNRFFLIGIPQLGCMQLMLLLYPTIGPFVVEKHLHFNAVVFGNSALVAGCAYFTGTLINRKLITVFSLKNIILFGYSMMLISFLIQLSLAFFAPLNLFTLVFPIVLICLCIGITFSNILVTCLHQFPKRAAMASSIQIFMGVILSSIGIFIISHFEIKTLLNVTMAYFITWLIQCVFFFFWKTK